METPNLATAAGLMIARVDRTLGRNEAGEPLISTDAGATRVRVIRTDEGIMIARAAIPLGGPPS